MLLKMTDLIKGMVVYPERMEHNLNLTGGLIFSQPVLLALVEKGASREDAYSLVQRHAMEVWERGGDFLRLLQDDPEVMALLSERELEACFNYDNLRRNIETIYKRLGI